MGNEGRVSSRRLHVAIIIAAIVCSGFIATLFFDCIHDYLEYSEDNLDLTREELTFVRYEKRHNRGGWYFDLYVKEYEEPLHINTISSNGLNKHNLSELAEDDMLVIAFSQNFGGICEIYCNDTVILSVSDYLNAQRNNEMIGMVFLPLVLLCVLFIAWVFLGAIRPIPDNDGLGKIRIEYIVKGNVIRVYHSRHTCSLVINGHIFDQHYGVYSSNFCLKGIIGMMNTGGQTVKVEARMGIVHMRLYCNGQQVAKKFMAFG